VRSVKDAYRAADNCVKDTREIVNEALSKMFDLPPIDVGAGLSMSKALVTLVGAEPDMQPKAIGECVWEATKLSGGVNAVYVSSSVREAWPSTKGGLLRFTACTMKGVDGYKVSKENVGQPA
jgi:class 3 adenylate cyclase